MERIELRIAVCRKFNRTFDCSIRVSWSFAIYIGGRAQKAFGRAWALPGPPLVMPLLVSATKQTIPCFQKALHTKVWHTFNKIIFDYEQLPFIHYFFLQQPTIFFIFFHPLEIYENYTNNVSVRFCSQKPHNNAAFYLPQARPIPPIWRIVTCLE